MIELIVEIGAVIVCFIGISFYIGYCYGYNSAKTYYEDVLHYNKRGE